MANAPGGWPQPPQQPWGYDPRYQGGSQYRPDLSKGTLPIVLVVSGLGFVAWATYFGTGTLKNIEVSQERILTKVETYAQRSDERAQRLESALAKSDKEGFTKTDHALWCLRAETVNRDWKCADNPRRVDTEGDERAPPIWRGLSGGDPSPNDWQTATTPRRPKQ